MAITITLKASGLKTSPNDLSVENGALHKASNVIIKRDNVVEPRRGFKLYGNSFGTSTDVAKQLIAYRDRILRHYSNKIQFDDGTGNFTDFNGEFLETETGLRIKSIEANKNLYFTTSKGIYKISANTPNDFSSSTGFVTRAGGIKALDFTARLDIIPGQQDGFLFQDSAVAYRVVWGTTDANNNLILGTPSGRVEIFNSLLTLLLIDFNRLLGALDDINQGASLITDGDYVSTLRLEQSATSIQLHSNLISLASKIDNDILYADNDGAPTGAPLELDTASITSGVTTINFASGDPSLYVAAGSNIFLAGFTTGTGSINGAQVATVVTSTSLSFNTTATGVVTIDPSATIVSNEYRSITPPAIPSSPPSDQELVAIQTYLQNIMLQLQAEPDGVIPTALQNAYIAILNITTSTNVILDITIPEEVTSSYFLQIYRSAVTSATGAATLSDIFPNDELQLVYEAFPTQAELAARLIEVEDITPDLFRGANLYTNPTTGEGITQANDIPPFAKDINRFKGYTFYANTRTKHRKALNLIGVSSMVTDFNNGNIPTITITNGVEENTYTFVVGVNEETRFTTVAGSFLVSGAAPGSYFLLNSANNFNKFYFWYKIGSSTDPMIAGRTGVPIIASAGDTATQIAQKTTDVLSRYNYYFNVTTSTNTFTVTNVDNGYTDNASAGTTGFTITILNDGVGEKISQESANFTTVADVAGNLAGKYFTFNTAFDRNEYYFWFFVSGVGTDPALTNKTGIRVDLVTNDSASTVATKIVSKITSTLSSTLTSSNITSSLTLTSVTYGPATNATVATSGFTLNSVTDGALQVALSDLNSPAQSVDATARSFIRIINKNETESVYGFYLSGANDVPGKMFFESRDFLNDPFYILGNNTNTGNSFSPAISPTINISSISTGNASTMLVTTSTPHGLQNLDEIVITNTNSSPNIDGLWQITYVSTTTFRINSVITTAGNRGSLIKASAAVFSDNEVRPNRIYYSKIQQPEAVPITNFIDVSAQNKQILRIFPLRDSLFVFKEDGLYRISGETAPFNLALFDTSCILKAPDSVDVGNNFIYGWTTQGIGALSESGFQIISRDIDIDILKLASNNYPNFHSITWGIGYDSDNSYLIYTNLKASDEVATIAYRYSNLTGTWTTFDKTNTCGIINPVDDKLYMGAGDTNFIEQERKSFTRTDYADREIASNLSTGRYFNNILKLNSVTNFIEGDVITQDQTLTVYDFNALLKKLDIDEGINDGNYYSLLHISGGADLRSSIVALATKLDADTGVSDTDYLSLIDTKSGSITSISAASPTVITSAAHGLQDGRIITISGTDSSPNIDGEFTVTRIDANTFSIDKSVTTPGTTGSFSTIDENFQDIKTCYNIIINKLNLDPGVSFSNYILLSNDTLLEAVITNINRISKDVTLNLTLNFVNGPLTVFKTIKSVFKYAPNTFGDPVTWKHIREATFLFKNKAFTNAKVRFYTDLLPEPQEILFLGQGNGIFGMGTGVFGDGFFGGNSHSAPFRTYVPRQCQRCIFMVIEFEHSVAREKFEIYGTTLSGEQTGSTRAYK